MAASVNERAIAVDREFLETTNEMGGTYTPDYVHNQHFVMYARAMQGRREDALRGADELEKSTAPMAREMPEMADAFSALPVLTYARFGEWKRILAMKSSVATWRYARTLALAGSGDRRGAEAERARFEELRGKIPADASWGQNNARMVMEMASQILAAKLAGSATGAVGHWEQAVALQDSFTYDEPPAWYYPVRESLGVALLRAGDAAAAERVLREGVRRSPKNGRMLFALVESLRAQEKKEEASWVEREFEASWARADVKLSLEEF
jgi:predicted Zn-dependent protease